MSEEYVQCARRDEILPSAPAHICAPLTLALTSLPRDIPSLDSRPYTEKTVLQTEDYVEVYFDTASSILPSVYPASPRIRLASVMFMPIGAPRSSIISGACLMECRSSHTYTVTVPSCCNSIYFFK